MTEVAKKDDRSVQERFTTLRNRIDLEASVLDRQSTAEWIATRLMDMNAAGTFEDLNKLADSSGMVASKDLVGRTLTILDFTVFESGDQYRENSLLQKYAIIRAVDENGEEMVVDGGGDNFVIGLVRMRDLYGCDPDLPLRGTITGKTTGAGTLVGWRWHDPKRPVQS